MKTNTGTTRIFAGGGTGILRPVKVFLCRTASVAPLLMVSGLLLFFTVSPVLGQSAPPPKVELDLDGSSLPPILPEVDIDNKLGNQLPLNHSFRNADGQEVSLQDIFDQGQPVVLQLGYFNCPSLCGFVMNGMMDSMKETSMTPGEDYQVISLSISEQETPELAQLKKANYIAAFGRPEASAGWHFLVGDEKDIRAVTDAVGFGYKYLPSKDQYAHPAAIMILTPDGKVARYLFGVKYDPQTFRLSLVEASDGKVGSTWDKFLMTCFVYDETAGQYNWHAMALMRLAGLLTVVVLCGVIGVMLWVGPKWRQTNDETKDTDTTS